MILNGLIVSAAFLAVVAEETARILVTAVRITVNAAWYYCKPAWAD